MIRWWAWRHSAPGFITILINLHWPGCDDHFMLLASFIGACDQTVLPIVRCCLWLFRLSTRLLFQFRSYCPILLYHKRPLPHNPLLNCGGYVACENAWIFRNRYLCICIFRTATSVVLAHHSNVQGTQHLRFGHTNIGIFIYISVSFIVYGNLVQCSLAKPIFIGCRPLWCSTLVMYSEFHKRAISRPHQCFPKGQILFSYDHGGHP